MQTLLVSSLSYLENNEFDRFERHIFARNGDIDREDVGSGVADGKW